MPDVDAVDIDFAAHTATIRMKAGKTTDRESVAAALGESGYGVESFTENAPAGH
jgi:hypothetical protein